MVLQILAGPPPIPDLNLVDESQTLTVVDKNSEEETTRNNVMTSSKTALPSESKNSFGCIARQKQ